MWRWRPSGKEKGIRAGIDEQKSPWLACMAGCSDTTGSYSCELLVFVRTCDIMIPFSLRAFTYSECSCGIADVMRNTFVIWQVRHGCKKIWQPTCLANIPPVIFFKILTNNIIC